MKTQNKRKTMIELILDKKSIQIDEEFLDIKKHLEKFYSNKEQETIAQTLENETEISCSYLWDKDFLLLEQLLENNLGHFTFESEFAPVTITMTSSDSIFIMSWAVSKFLPSWL